MDHHLVYNVVYPPDRRGPGLYICERRVISENLQILFSFLARVGVSEKGAYLVDKASERVHVASGGGREWNTAALGLENLRRLPGQRTHRCDGLDGSPR